MSVIVIVRIFVGALTGPTVLLGASGFRWMYDVWFRSPLYVPSGAGAAAGAGIARVDPSSPLASSLLPPLSLSGCSSNHSAPLVASRRAVSSAAALARSASKMVSRAMASSTPCRAAASLRDDAVTAAEGAVFFRRLMRWPASSSEEEKASLSESEAGGGVAGRLRRLALDLAPRFLKMATGAAGSWSAILSVMGVLWTFGIV